MANSIPTRKYLHRRIASLRPNFFAYRILHPSSDDALPDREFGRCWAIFGTTITPQSSLLPSPHAQNGGWATTTDSKHHSFDPTELLVSIRWTYYLKCWAISKKMECSYKNALFIIVPKKNSWTSLPRMPLGCVVLDLFSKKKFKTCTSPSVIRNSLADSPPASFQIFINR